MDSDGIDPNKNLGVKRCFSHLYILTEYQYLIGFHLCIFSPWVAIHKLQRMAGTSFLLVTTLTCDSIRGSFIRTASLLLPHKTLCRNLWCFESLTCCGLDWAISVQMWSNVGRSYEGASGGGEGEIFRVIGGLGCGHSARPRCASHHSRPIRILSLDPGCRRRYYPNVQVIHHLIWNLYMN